MSHGEAVKADIDLDNVGHAVLGAILELALLDAARSVRGVRMLGADAGAEQLEAAAGAGRLDDGVLNWPLLPNCSATAVVNG